MKNAIRQYSIAMECEQGGPILVTGNIHYNENGPALAFVKIESQQCDFATELFCQNKQELIIDHIEKVAITEASKAGFYVLQ